MHVPERSMNSSTVTHTKIMFLVINIIIMVTAVLSIIRLQNIIKCGQTMVLVARIPCIIILIKQLKSAEIYTHTSNLTTYQWANGSQTTGTCMCYV